MKLSDIPVSHILTADNWLTGARGTKGRVVSLQSVHSGNIFDLYMSIQWVSGATSYVLYPDECDNITVDLSMYSKVLPSYVQYQVELHEKYKAFWRTIEKK